MHNWTEMQSSSVVHRCCCEFQTPCSSPRCFHSLSKPLDGKAGPVLPKGNVSRCKQPQPHSTAELILRPSARMGLTPDSAVTEQPNCIQIDPQHHVEMGSCPVLSPDLCPGLISSTSSTTTCSPSFLTKCKFCSNLSSNTSQLQERALEGRELLPKARVGHSSQGNALALTLRKQNSTPTSIPPLEEKSKSYPCLRGTVQQPSTLLSPRHALEQLFILQTIEKFKISYQR